MIRVVSDPHVFDAMIYGSEPQPGVLDFLHNSVNSFTNLSNTLTNAGREFASKAHSVLDMFNGSEALRSAKAALRKVGSIFQYDEIRPLSELHQIQNAPLIMQRFIMAEPTVRRMFHDQRCSGYENTYVDIYPNRNGDNHYDYQRAMNGLVVDVVDEDGEDSWKSTTYFNENIEAERDLTHREQIDIQTSWDYVRYYMGLGKNDPTSEHDNDL